MLRRRLCHTCPSNTFQSHKQSGQTKKRKHSKVWTPMEDQLASFAQRSAQNYPIPTPTKQNGTLQRRYSNIRGNFIDRTLNSGMAGILHSHFRTELLACFFKTDEERPCLDCISLSAFLSVPLSQSINIDRAQVHSLFIQKLLILFLGPHESPTSCESFALMFSHTGAAEVWNHNILPIISTRELEPHASKGNGSRICHIGPSTHGLPQFSRRNLKDLSAESQTGSVKVERYAYLVQLQGWPDFLAAFLLPCCALFKLPNRKMYRVVGNV